MLISRNLEPTAELAGKALNQLQPRRPPSYLLEIKARAIVLHVQMKTVLGADQSDAHIDFAGFAGRVLHRVGEEFVHNEGQRHCGVVCKLARIRIASDADTAWKQLSCSPADGAQKLIRFEQRCLGGCVENLLRGSHCSDPVACVVQCPLRLDIVRPSSRQAQHGLQHLHVVLDAMIQLVEQGPPQPAFPDVRCGSSEKQANAPGQASQLRMLALKLRMDLGGSVPQLGKSAHYGKDCSGIENDRRTTAMIALSGRRQMRVRGRAEAGAGWNAMMLIRARRWPA